MMVLTKTFSDFDIAFIAHPVTGDISKRYDENAIKNSIINLILSKPYERMYQPDLSCGITGLLFEPVSEVLKEAIQTSIEEVIESYEPRVKILYINVDEQLDNNGYDVSISFYIINAPEASTLNLFLERLA